MNEKTFDAMEYHLILQQAGKFAWTSKGRETINRMKPSTNKRQIERWLEEVTEAVSILRISSSVPIHSLDEVTHILTQAKKGMYIRADQFTQLISFIDHCEKLKKFMDDKGHVAPTISLYAYSISDLSDLGTEIQRCLRHGQVDDFATKELSRIRKQLHIQQTRLKEKIQQLVKSSKYASLLQDKTVAEKNGRYVLSVKREHRGKVKGTVIDHSASGATLFIEPSEIGALQEEIQLLKMSEEHEVEQVLYYLTGYVLEFEHNLEIAVDTMHQYDVIFAKAKYSISIDGIAPMFNNNYLINLQEARHPLLGEDAVPLSLRFGEGDQALVITGPNTGGKTVTLKTIGLLTLMAQSGMHIPAAEGTSLHLFQQIFVDIGDGQSITQNLSTFSSRLVNIIEILREANDRSLVLLDELGSGTDPGEGMGLATAILEQLFAKGATIFATTHYSEMKEFAEEQPGFINGSMEFDLATLAPTYKLIIGTAGRSQALDIAAKLGMHPEILERAHQITYKQEKNFHKNLHDYKSKEMEKQVAVNRYARTKEAAVPSKQKTSTNKQFKMGDNVTVLSTKETAIVYKGPDTLGNYVVQMKGEKYTFNHKRLKLHIPAEELYPDDYDFDIIFKSKEYRKVKKQLDRKHVEGLVLDEEE
ncbi:endonuclease MutS2 [Thalassobacillus pellis]|uniref:endonuclease MutS2 n=1 Tax=Thalassobacillus pellis TaxID=748008 RepID=UPI00195FEB74|nr:endonuclease MutS2 [Thalassobacillus pellis]MBM7553737.1 MutS2 family protein [Thalassobacillus pellis]